MMMKYENNCNNDEFQNDFDNDCCGNSDDQ